MPLKKNFGRLNVFVRKLVLNSFQFRNTHIAVAESQIHTHTEIRKIRKQIHSFSTRVASDGSTYLNNHMTAQFIPGKNFKNDGNQKIIPDGNAKFSFDFGLILEF